MKFGEIHHDGSFTALGIGFFYEYTALAKTLNIFRAGSRTPLYRVIFDTLLSEGAPDYARIFEKTSRIAALRYSNNETLSLADTFTGTELLAVIENTVSITMNAFDLEQGQFDRFQRRFLQESGLRRLEITEKPSHDPLSRNFTMELETARRNSIAVRSSSLHGALHFLAEKIMQDLIAREFSLEHEANLQKLLRISSILSSMSLTLNTRFDPSRLHKQRIMSLFSEHTKNVESIYKTN